MNLPVTFTGKVLRVFGDSGSAWLPKLPDLLKECRRKWSLQDCIPCANMSMNYIEFATTTAGQAVALKVGVPHKELFTEMEALRHYAGKGAARLLDADRELGAILMQRAQPGAMLWELGDNTQEAKVAATVMRRLSASAPSAHTLPYFSEWVERAFRLTRTEWDPQERMPRRLLDVAEAAFHEIKRTQPVEALLHGDLHHENILLDEKAGWIAIDPKGVIGAPCLEVGRFMHNQLHRLAPKQREAVVMERIDIFSVELGYPRELVAASGLVDLVLSHCWCFEDNGIDDNWYQDIELAWKLVEVMRA